MKRKNLRILIECAIMVALSAVLSYLKVYEMPFGGSITFASMLPLAVISYRHGMKFGFPTAFVAGGIQLLQGLHNLAYAKTFVAVLAIIFLDYLLAFTLIGLAGAFRNLVKEQTKLSQAVTLGAGIFISVMLRFFCHLVSGAVVWYELTKEWYVGDSTHIVNLYGPWMYSFLYNIAFMGPELLITLIVGVFLAYFINFKSDTLLFKGN